jgi:murein DD-endopeptidase MepM/ murein hydrolase activator NlpD
MGRFLSKTYRIGKLSVSIIYNEIIFLYRGKKRIYLRKIKRYNLFSPVKIVIYVTSIVLTVIVLSVIPESDSIITEGSSDVDIKNKILFSKETDYSDPLENIELKIVEHRVKRGETLSEIAKEYGISMDTICGCNKLESYDIIREGAQLKIPNKDGILYKLKRGQKLVPIAKKYKASIDKIIAGNTVRNPDFFPAEKYIFIPDAKPLNIIPGFLWPAFRRIITSGYGWRRHPINRVMHFHQGIDIRLRYQWIRSTKFGKVTYAGWMGGYGRTVIIAHPGGWKSLYGHLSRIIVRKGQYVKQGQLVGKSGNTGASTGAHLHFELIKNGKHRNPYKYVR